MDRRPRESDSDGSALRSPQPADRESSPTLQRRAPGGEAGPGPRAGERLGRYFILETLGEGGMGVVHAAFDPALERRVAIKLLQRRGDETEEQRARLLAEAQAMARLSHPNVVTVHEAAVDRGRVYIAMEYVPGRTLRVWLVERERSWREIVEVFRQAALGLAAAHNAGMIHRDVKPDNILIGTDERVRITDFGVAQQLELTTPQRSDSGEHSASRSWPGVAEPATAGEAVSRELAMATGTPVYMSPEQLRGAPLDARSDQFSFGVTLFEALFRRRPFPGRRPSELRRAHATVTVAIAPSEPAVPPWLRRLVLRTLAIEPEQRWPSMQAIAKQLEQGASPIPRRLRALLLAAVPAAALVGAIVGGRVAEPTACAADEPISERWNDTAREQIGATMQAAAPAFAQDTARTVVRMLDDYAQAWTEGSTNACTAHRDGLESDTLFDRRQSCLRARRRAVEGLIDILTHADADVVSHAIEAVDSLPAVRECDAARLLDDGAWSLPSDPKARAQHEDTLDLLTQVETMFRAGQFRAGLAQAEEAVVRARALEGEALLPRALLARERYQSRLDQADAAQASAEEAWHVALRSGNAADAVRAATQMVVLLGYDRKQEAPALSRVSDAESLLARLRRHSPELAEELTPALLRAQGLVELRSGRRGDAITHLRTSLERYRVLPGRHDLQLAEHLNSLANAEFAEGQHEAALAHYEEALALQIAVLGPEHPGVVGVHNNLGLLLRNMGRPGDGLVHLVRAHGIAVAAFGEEHSSATMAARNIAAVHHQMQHPELAVPMWERGWGLPPALEPGDSGGAHRALEFAADLEAVGRRADAGRVYARVAELASGDVTLAVLASKANAGVERTRGAAVTARDAAAR